MEKEYNLSNIENTNPESIGPSVDALKNRFKEGSIPLQTDYSDLINIADIGRQAVGKAPNQIDNPNSGLVLNNDSGLAVKVNISGGLQADKDGVSVKIKDKSLLADNNGLSVNYGKGLQLDKDNDNKLTINSHDGIEIVAGGVKVKAGNGITVNSSGVSIDPNTVLPRGMIVMFSGKSVPTGWTLCDGNNGTPNLIDRFILGGNFSGIDGKSSTTVSGPKDSKSFNFNSNEATLNINGKTSERSLSIGQIPNHSHLSGINIDTNIMAQYGATQIGKTDRAVASSKNTSERYLYYSSGILSSNGTIGQNSPETHDHDINLTNTGNHFHKNQITTPYYILAFIMKT
ncbi:hypothetical protein GPY51_05250 [Photorhabdus laumondii subsp. laumondii]|uniref:Photorhabdus luminescens subsp. laumondii TTO1 complete genome segment 6/17 n=2 Tax=Photorhabdus laumondii subsp. laumondii TaxID=141679 RepID=Q7N687_PHOLL|nr:MULTISPECIES: tail fiber protein [Photorhabdus]AWK41519.1 hypothetical protein A4R40_08465 [Photorhabdus laumondii subsp. laumondii]AXG42319.1 hypothetical protein PluDJC_08665 [Photorhabdus laumondii subsp. laumondii]AXG46842.1 hypothetical protein PluTT01m_08685 [Photorhabdus laumondii subsp. laumondii]KTL61408.1 hypothetical protein AA106_08795 [Photorhabdus laumondii subsp. laumondii]MCC8382143.1 tail fiber protein [Photorhabdus laumondii]